MRQEMQLQEVYEGLYDGPHATPKPSDVGPVFLGIKNITEDGRLDLTNIRHISEDEFPKWTKRVTPQEGDIVFSYEASLHLYAIIPKGFRGCLGRRMALIRPNAEKINTKYLFYYFFSSDWREEVGKYILTGATVDRIPLTKTPEFIVKLPPKEQQDEIAGIIDAYSNLIENNNRRIAILEEMAQSLYREWFVKFRFPGHENTKFIDSPLGKIPEGWEVKPFTDIADVLSGGTPKTKVSEYWGGDIPFFAPKDAPSGYYVLKTEKKITDLGLSKCASKLYPKNTIFITARGTVGKVVMPVDGMAMNQSCYALKGKDGISQYFLFLLTKNKVEYLKKNTGGAIFDTIVTDTFRRMNVIEPLSDMVSKFSGIVKPLFDEILNLTKKNENLKRQRELILPKLISGSVEIRG